MGKQHNSVQEFERLQRLLLDERAQITSRLAELDKVFASVENSQDSAPATAPAAALASRASGKLTMREAVQQATAAQPLGIRDIVDAIKKLGYRFKSSNPQNSVGAYLYGPEGKKHFTKQGGTFTGKGRISLANANNGAKPAKRKMSAAGRRAIAEGARKRWAAYNKAKKK